jgi:hypothetical protein
MDCIAGRQASVLKNDLLCTLDCFIIDRQNLIYDAQERVEGWLNCIPAIDRDVTVKYFLQHFRIRYQSLASSYKLFQRPLGLAFMRMSGADKVHRDVGINENHERVFAP